MRFLFLIAKIADSFVFWFLMYQSFLQFNNDKIFEMCALICTAVFWQRAWKSDILNKLKEFKEFKGV